MNRGERGHMMTPFKTDGKLLRKLAACVVVAMTATVASGYSVTANNQAGLPNEAMATLNLPKFDASVIPVGPGEWVELTGVNVAFEVRLAGARVELDNDAEYAQKATAYVSNTAQSFTSTVSLLLVGLSTINAGDFGLVASQAFDLDATTGDALGFTATGLGDYADWQPGTLAAGKAGDIHSMVWSDYVGSGDFQVSIQALYLTSATFEGENGFFQGNTPTGTFHGQVEYTYAIVPEPATMSLLGLGAIALLRKRRA
jgi:hypothetical protein